LVFSGSMDFSPMALIREIVKQGTGNLHLISSASAAVNADLLIGAGAVDSVEFPQIAFGEYGLAPHFRKLWNPGGSSTGTMSDPPSWRASVPGPWVCPLCRFAVFLGSDYMRVREDFREIANPL
jgi:glutaconate CoA-transferase, subunit A